MFRFMRKSSRVQWRIRHFKNQKIDYAKYVDDFFLDGELAYISCNVKSADDIINAYSVKDYEILNPEFVNFIEENARYIPQEYPILLEICGCKFSQEQQQVIQETIRDHFALRLGDAQLGLDKNRGNALRLLIMGIACMLIMYGLAQFSAMPEIFQVSVDFLMWYFLWVFIDVGWLDRRDLSEEKIAVTRLANVKVVFKEKFEDGHDADSVTNKVLADVFLSLESFNGNPMQKRQIEELYQDAFPAIERENRKDFFSNSYDGKEILVGYLDGQFAGFAQVLTIGDLSNILYFAISEEMRGLRLGSAFLEKIKERYPENRILADIEHPNPKVPNNVQRELRKKFYLENGFKPTQILSVWRGEEYDILSVKGNVTQEEFKSFWDTYDQMEGTS